MAAQGPAIAGTTSGGRGEIGRRSGLKIRFFRECGFESRRPHHNKINLLYTASSHHLRFIWISGTLWGQ